MKIATTAEMIRSGGLGEGNTFTIAASSKAFEVLSNSLYQNKILAVIREISCNAADAHKLAGRPLSDIQIHLPTYGEPWFAVRDFGPSLSHDAVLRLYTTYFLSTKDQNDDLIGGFGLGSKAPFAVADQFTVTTWRDGVERRYVCYKQDGVPNINFISEAQSSEPTGLEVRVAVPSSSVGRWISEGYTYFAWWPTLPAGLPDSAKSTLAELTVKSPRMIGAYPEWACLEGTTSRAIMGLVPYTINYEAIPNLPKNLNYLAAVGMLFSFEVGELSISPSRETLSYDPKTCAAIIARLKSTHDSLTQTIQDYVASAPTLFEARVRRYSDAMVGFNRALGSYVGIVKWRGQDVTAQVAIDTSLDFKSTVTTGSYVRRSNRKMWFKHYVGTYYEHNVTLPERRRAIFYADKITTSTYRRIAHHMETKYGTSSDRTAILFSGPDKAEIERVFLEKGLPAPVDVATLPALPATPRTKAAAPKTTAYTFNSDGSFQRNTTPVDLTKGGTYVLFREGAIVYDDLPVQSSVRLGLLPDHTKVIGISEATLKSSKTLQTTLDTNGWVRFDHRSLLAALPKAEVLAALWCSILNDTAGIFKYSTWQYEFVSALRSRNEFANFTCAALRPLQNWLHPAKPLDTRVIKCCNEFNTLLRSMYAAEVAQFTKEPLHFEAAVDALGTKYPLLKSLRWDRVRKDELVDYLSRS